MALLGNQCGSRAVAVLMMEILSTVMLSSVVYSQTNQAMVPIAEHTAPALQNAVLLGHSDPNSMMTIVVALKMQNEQEFDDLLDGLNDPSSPDFLQFLTPDDFLSRYATAQEDVDSVSVYLASQGLSIQQVTSNHMFIQASGTVSQVEQAFSININKYLVNAKEHFSNDRNPSVPLSLHQVVQSVLGLSSLENPHKMSNAANTPAFVYTPSQIATTYNLPNALNTYSGQTIYDGSGSTIAIPSASTFNPSDLDTFFSVFEINRTGTLTVVPVDGGTTDIDLEPTLDIQLAGAEALGADILVYEAQDTFAAFTLMYNQIASDNRADIVSVSWVACESDTGSSVMQAQDSAIKQGAAQGMTFFVSSGDAGAYACPSTSTTLAVNYPSSSRYVTAVGGTSLILNSQGNSSSETTSTGPGGGKSSFWSKPRWQNGPGVPRNNMRDLPDVAFDGNDITGYYSYFQGLWYSAGGTSIGAPAWAAIWAMGLQARHGQRIGNAAPLFYQLGASSKHQTDFHDITSGNNGDGLGLGYNATKQYDLSTGWGTPNAANLIESLKNQ
jgi:subtilase family serine protease